MKIYAPVIVRLGIAFVLIWFGAQQLIDPLLWSSYVPGWVTDISQLSGETVAIINGVIEIVFGSLLALGLFVRVVALLMVVHIALIAISLGYNSVAIRDWGLAIATFGIFLHGPDIWSLGRLRSSANSSTVEEI